MKNLFTIEKIGDIFYYRTYTQEGKRVRFTTKCTKKNEALALIQKRIIDGTLASGGKTVADKTIFSGYSLEFWTNDCPYCKMQKLLGRPLQPRTIIDRRSALEQKVYPYIGNLPLSAITTKMLSSMQLDLFDKGYSSASIKKLNSVLNPIFESAIDDGVISSNPMTRLKNITVTPKYPRDAFTLEEIGLLFNCSPEDWGNPLVYWGALLSAMTGMRLGEILALQRCDIEIPHLAPTAYIHVDHSYNARERVLKTPKNGKARIVPVTRETAAMILTLSPSEYSFIFSINGNTPVAQTYIRNVLNRRMKEVGITRGQLTFHSFRHFANTHLVSAGTQSEVVRSIIGHSSSKMTDHYYHGTKEALDKVASTMRNII